MSPSCFFSEWAMTELIKHELIHFREFKYQHNDTTPEDEYRMYLAYLLIVDKLLLDQDERSDKAEQNYITNYFQVTWPITIQQYEFTHKSNPILEALKSNLFLTELYNDPEHQLYVSNYLNHYNFARPWDYISGFLHLVKPHIMSIGENNLPLLRLTPDSPYLSIIQSKTIDISNYQENETLQVRYKGIRERPIFKYDDNKFLVLNWEFLYSQIGLGIVFDLYSKSGINEKYKSFLKFKERVSKDFYEEKLFRGILSFIYSKKHHELHMPADEKYPDAYLRDGNDLYLFEFKDALFPDRLIEDPTYQELISIVEERFVKTEKGKAKGIGQLISQINYLSENEYDFDNFTHKKFKRTQIDIYPVLVYSHFQFSYPGINKYIEEKFEQMFSNNKFRRVHTPIMISIDYIYNNLKMFKENKLCDIIKSYRQTIKSLDKKFKTGKRFDLITARFAAVEQVNFTPPKGRGSLAGLTNEEFELLLKKMNLNDA